MAITVGTGQTRTRISKYLLLTTAIVESATGVALLAIPVQLVALLLGAALDTPAGVAVARVAGAAIVSLGYACWAARHDTQSRSAIGLVTALLLYNAIIFTLLLWLRFKAGMTGVGLLPAAGAHAALAVWCVASLRGKSCIQGAAGRN